MPQQNLSYSTTHHGHMDAPDLASLPPHYSGFTVDTSGGYVTEAKSIISPGSKLF
jgi:hypothetical protein